MKVYQVIITINESGKEFQKTIKIQANNTSELSQKFKALESLSKHLNHDDLMDTVDLISEKPQLISIIKELIAETENLNELQIGLKAPFMIKRVINALKD